MSLTMLSKTKLPFLMLWYLSIVISCNVMEVKSPNDPYEIINSYYGGIDQHVLGTKTMDISSYSKNLGNISAWQNANDDLSNLYRPNVDFISLFERDEFTAIMKEFTKQATVRLDKKKLNNGIDLKKSAKNLISFPYVFSKEGTKYALMYEEVTEGPENAAGGVTLFRKEQGIWKDIFHFHLWIS